MRLVILRTVSESSTISTSGCVPAAPPARVGRSPMRPIGRPARTSVRRRGRASCTGLMISTISPVPSTVAPEMPGHARELRSDVLHHDFLVADHLVDMDRRVALAAAQQQHRVVALGFRIVRRVAQQARQVVERIRAPLPLDLALDVDVEQRLRLHLLHLLDHRRGQRPEPSAGAHQHRLRHRQRERQREREAGAAPGSVATSTRPPSAAISLRTTSMPMPRPEICVTFEAVENPGSKRNSTSCASVGFDVGREQARPPGRGRARAARSTPPPSSASSITTSLPTWRTRRARSRPSRTCRRRAAPRATRCRGRARCAAGARAGPTSFSSTERSSSTWPPWISRLARLSSSRAVGAQDAVQALRQAAERHRADREQPLLHLARQARLREQRGIGVVEVLEQRLLHRRDVVDALGQRARQLLEARVAVELERIELVVLLLQQRHLRLDLRFGLDLDLAHLSRAGGSRWWSVRAGWP